MIEAIGLGFLYRVVKDLWAFARHRQRILSPQEIIELRQKWKPQFEEELWNNHKNSLRQDVIIRDMKRMDSYPETDSERQKGISPWFRAGLIDIYHRGAMIGLRWGEFVFDEQDEVWRIPNCDRGEIGEISAILVGFIPFENIQAVDWGGDEYYHHPHIYCHFGSRNEPYERVAVCKEIRNPNTRPHFTELASYEEILDNSKRHGVLFFG